MKKLEELPKKYPELFEDVFFFQCGDGWYNILDCLLHHIKQTLGRYREVVRIKERIESEGKDTPEWIIKYFEDNKEDPLDSFEIVQVKEKFGGLRFYWGAAVDAKAGASVEGAIALAEDLSFRVCEVCGNPGTCGSIKGRGWLQTLCAQHREERAVKTK